MNKASRYPLMLPLLLRLRPDACAEFRFHPTRKWRADFAIPSAKLLIEIDGGAWSGGRHTRGAGFIADQSKLNAAACLGYRVLRYVPADCTAKNIAIILAQVKDCVEGWHAL